MIDEGSSWPEIVPTQNKHAGEITKLVGDYWFSRYPRPLYFIYDNGGEFIGTDFTETLEMYGVDSKLTTVIIHGLHESLHLVLCEMLRTE